MESRSRPMFVKHVGIQKLHDWLFRHLLHLADSDYRIAYGDVLSFLSLPNTLRPFSILGATSSGGVDFPSVSFKFCNTWLWYHNFWISVKDISCNPVSRFHSIQPTLCIVSTVYVISIRLAYVQTPNKGYILL